MHGRLKVRTTEEERERKKKEQALKVRAMNAAMKKILAKRQKEEYDDEMLQTTLPILQRNPDVYTLWNIRRLCVQKKATSALDTTENTITEEQLQSIYDTELNITEQCLMVNPKSYAAWHHRCWTLENSPNANWQREMQLCTKYLKLDERNFHTWDYRRYVAKKAGVSKEQELNFCTDKIKTNFSNYSSWHYRSLLLPELYPYKSDVLPKRPMSEEKLKEELEMVLSAAFTDPNDSSAWFYQRWLLSYSRPELGVCGFRCDDSKAVVAFTKPINANSITISIHKGETCVHEFTQWCSRLNTTMSSIWFSKVGNDFHIDKSENYSLIITIPKLDTKKLQLSYYDQSLYYVEAPNPPFVYTQDVLTELQSQLDSCNSLLELEPDSKWTLLTTALLMRAIDRTKYHEKSLEYLQKLVKVDELRRGYYEDLGSKWIMEHLLTNWIHCNEAPKELNLSAVPNLTSIGSYEQYFAIADKITLSTSLDNKYRSKGKVIMSFNALTSLIKDCANFA